MATIIKIVVTQNIHIKSSHYNRIFIRYMFLLSTINKTAIIIIKIIQILYKIINIYLKLLNHLTYSCIIYVGKKFNTYLMFKAKFFFNIVRLIEQLLSKSFILSIFVNLIEEYCQYDGSLETKIGLLKIPSKELIAKSHFCS